MTRSKRRRKPVVRKPECFYSWEESGDGFVAIVDNFAEIGWPAITITNGVEKVIEELKGHLRRGARLIYRDSEGLWDEIVVEKGKFVRFNLLRAPDLDAALKAIGIERQYGIWCEVWGGKTGTRSAWLKVDEKPQLFPTFALAEEQAGRIMAVTTLAWQPALSGRPGFARLTRKISYVAREYVADTREVDASMPLLSSLSGT